MRCGEPELRVADLELPILLRMDEAAQTRYGPPQAIGGGRCGRRRTGSRGWRRPGDRLPRRAAPLRKVFDRLGSLFDFLVDQAAYGLAALRTSARPEQSLGRLSRSARLAAP